MERIPGRKSRPDRRARIKERKAEANLGPSPATFISSAELVVKQEQSGPKLVPEAQAIRATARSTSKLVSAILDQVVHYACSQPDITMALLRTQTSFETKLHNMTPGNKDIHLYRQMSDALTAITSSTDFNSVGLNQDPADRESLFGKDGQLLHDIVDGDQS